MDFSSPLLYRFDDVSQAQGDKLAIEVEIWTQRERSFQYAVLTCIALLSQITFSLFDVGMINISSQQISSNELY